MSFNKLKLKRSAVTGRYPTTASLDLGELAINTYDGKVFLKKDDGVQTIVQLADVSGSILSASYASTSSYSDQFRVAGTLTAQTLIVQTVSSSIIYSSGSNIFGNNLTNTQIFTGSVSVTGSLNVRGGGITGSLDNLRGSATHIPYFSSSQVLANSAMLQSTNNFSIAINQDDVTAGAPEALYVYQPSTSSFNVISGKGNLNNYLQLNIQNTNQGISASSDIVATANNGDENSNYINMGINSNLHSGPIGDVNDAYLFSTGNDLHIGNASPGQPVQFFAGGANTNTNRKLQLSAVGNHQMTGSLDANASITASAFVTRGATAAQFVKGDGTLDSTNYLSSSVFFASSASLNLFTASINVATASLYRATASLYNFSSSILNFTSSQLVLNGTYATTGSNQFNGNQTITGSLIQGLGNIATGENSHAEGDSTQAIGLFSHAEGLGTIAYGGRSHAEGQDTIASGSYSHAEGYQTIALADHQHVQGQYNAVSSVPSAFIVGNGTDDGNRSNLIHAAGNVVEITGSVNVYGGGFNVDGVNVLDTALAYAIALG
jgi:hypothetical protein